MLKSHPIPFLGDPESMVELDSAPVVILPFGYEGGISYGRGAAGGPQAVIEASQYLELYDEILEVEPSQVGIFTLAEPPIAKDPEKMVEQLQALVQPLLERDKFVILVGGDHSITNGYLRALSRQNALFGVIQLDAHADLRESYAGSPLSHACTMARALELTPHCLQIGIRSMSKAEARRIQEQNLALYTMQDWRKGRLDLAAALDRLPPKVFLTLDVDVFDWSVISKTGTPEPGGCYWDEAMDLLGAIFDAKDIIGVDVVELSHDPQSQDTKSAFAVAKLIYKMIGWRFFR
jgi:N1-aminopropylagmatine ureohydrolase